VAEDGDGYAASQLLLPSRWESVRAKVQGDLIVAAPARDRIFATGSRNVGAVMMLRTLAREGFGSEPYPVTPVLLRWTGGGWAAYP
jgi:uncharacterized protein YtpQ (UPF0354 family)